MIFLKFYDNRRMLGCNRTFFPLRFMTRAKTLRVSVLWLYVTLVEHEQYTNCLGIFVALELVFVKPFQFAKNGQACAT